MLTSRMRALSEFVKEWLVPGTMSCLLAGTIVGVVLLNVAATATLGRVWLTLFAALYLLLSMPAVSSFLIARMQDTHPAADAGGRPDAATAAADALIVVGNGSVHYTDGDRRVDYLTRRSVFCAFEAARIYAQARPSRVIATGGVAGHPSARPEAELLRDLLVDLGVPVNQIGVEARSRTTAEQVANVCALLRAAGVRDPFIVVTTPAHMRRVLALFDQHGVRTIAATTPELRYDEGRTGWRRWWPSMAALTGSASAVYELLANAQTALMKNRRRPRK
ncbi:MAG: YdcF family protein [Acidobacteria bacterium]|nr:YdcF family protein [Acidobacteriota bacterium]